MWEYAGRGRSLKGVKTSAWYTSEEYSKTENVSLWASSSSRYSVFFCFHFVILVIKHISYLRNNSWISNAVHAWIGLVDYWLMWVKQKLSDIHIKEK